MMSQLVRGQERTRAGTEPSVRHLLYALKANGRASSAIWVLCVLGNNCRVLVDTLFRQERRCEPIPSHRSQYNCKNNRRQTMC